MPQITKLATMHCGSGGHDKVYGVAIIQQGTARALVTFHGPRLSKALNVRTLYPALIDSEFQRVCASKAAHQYQSVDWRNDYYRMKSTVYAIGTPPDEQAVPDEDKPVVFKKPVQVVKQPVVTKEPALGRLSSAPRDFI